MGLATPSTSADTCDADQVPRDEGQHPRAEDHQPREHPAPRDEHHDSTNLKMICESINLKSDVIPGTSAASPSTPASSVANDNRCTGEGDDDESLPTSSPELTMIHDMLKSAHTQLITMNARDYGFAARSPD